jgi:hypothetical protein
MHLRYLRYVLLHKWYVLRFGIVINGWSLPWLWRLLVHDASKFSPVEWCPYAVQFYGRETLTGLKFREQSRRFNHAWLHHLHHNPHHWQHWLLQQDSGTLVVLVPPIVIVNEMIADWLAAGPKILARPTLMACVAETIMWYANNASHIQLRQEARTHVEHTLHALARHYHLDELVETLHEARGLRAALVIERAQSEA